MCYISVLSLTGVESKPLVVGGAWVTDWEGEQNTLQPA